jgi:signal peptidase I
VSEGWDNVPRARDGVAPPAEAERPLRRHTQRRRPDADGRPAAADETSHRLPTGRQPDPSSFDPTLTALDVPFDDGERLAGGAPLGPPTGPLPGAPAGRQTGPVTGAQTGPVTGAPAAPPTGLPLGPPAPARHERGFAAAIGPSSAGTLQPGSRLRVGPRHGSGGRRSDDHGPKSPLRAALGAAGEIVVVLGMALLLSLLIKTFLVQAFFIPSTSMENTLLVGDRVLVSKLTPGVFELHRGDVVVFKDPGGWLSLEESVPLGDQTGVGATLRNALSFVGLLPQDAGEHLIKRVIGVGGDHVQCCDAKGRVEVDGVPIDETRYLFPGAAPSEKPFDVTVPYGYLWVMGDNRPVSADSRLHRALNNGMVPVHDVVGKAFVIVWPFDRAGGLGISAGVFGRVPQPAPH